MHLVRISIEGLPQGRATTLDFSEGEAVRKWTILPEGRLGRKTLIAIAASITPGRIAHLLTPPLSEQCRRSGHLRTELVCLREGRDAGAHGAVAGGWQLVNGEWERCSATRRHAAAHEGRARALGSATPLGNLVLAYGRAPTPGLSDAFDFSDTEYPYRRISSLLDPRASLTHPVRFLERLSAKAHELGTPRQKRFLGRLCRALASVIEPDERSARSRGCSPALCVSQWATRGFAFAPAWARLRAWERRVACVVIDLARHAYDAFPCCESPFDQSAVLLLDRPDRYCPGNRLNRFFAALDKLLPRGQVVVTLGRAARERMPHVLEEARLGKPAPHVVRRPPYRSVRIFPRPARIPRGSVVLVQVDGTLPNFALMQLSRHLKAKGQRVWLSLREPKVEQPCAVYASCIFATAPSLGRVERLRERYGERLVVGGSGVDLTLRLGSEIEALAPDYSLYPSLGDRAIGFLTRGCPGRCAFCAVPKKEGQIRQVADLDMLLQGRRKKLILLDDNLLAHPKAAELLEEMVRRGLRVNFNQTLDLRRLTAEHADLLRRLRCCNLAFHRRVYHFSLNDCRNLESLRRRYDLLRVTSADNVEFVCMYGYNTSLAEDLERLRFLRSLPRAYVFMQRYQPIPGGPASDLSRLFDERSDEHLDVLIRIVFAQNMKNVERYYRWLCLGYARQRGRIHRGLVDTLFRYNNRHMRGAFLQQLEEMARAHDLVDAPFQASGRALSAPDDP
jgi:hypothetical protein